ncbi:hypothetical protein JCM30471_23620 [Desulfuromonas carbonis]
MNIYQVEKLECPVTLFLCDGHVREGVIFLSPCSASHSGPETPLELFNDDAPFFAFRKADDSFSLVNKATICHLRFPPDPDAPPTFGHRLQVRMVFLGGEVLKGTLTLEAPEGKGRLQDFLNTHHGFFLLDSGPAHYLVNPLLICEIAPA